MVHRSNISILILLVKVITENVGTHHLVVGVTGTGNTIFSVSVCTLHFIVELMRGEHLSDDLLGRDDLTEVDESVEFTIRVDEVRDNGGEKSLSSSSFVGITRSNIIDISSGSIDETLVELELVVGLFEGSGLEGGFSVVVNVSRITIRVALKLINLVSDSSGDRIISELRGVDALVRRIISESKVVVSLLVNCIRLLLVLIA